MIPIVLRIEKQFIWCLYMDGRQWVFRAICTDSLSSPTLGFIIFNLVEKF